ncbi:hypothetical protein BCV70DRAFT_8236 [Testicularia cyperi]|uniref:Uncharacterized protein n=1 Tax=Testicularia cyperi TaxID=1882483 RepID=A0A317XYA6_9BASI|nr:hypothetical protein BCV70DRAFT_8236 [Testicularia cyperi]
MLQRRYMPSAGGALLPRCGTFGCPCIVLHLLHPSCTVMYDTPPLLAVPPTVNQTPCPGLGLPHCLLMLWTAPRSPRISRAAQPHNRFFCIHDCVFCPPQARPDSAPASHITPPQIHVRMYSSVWPALQPCLRIFRAATETPLRCPDPGLPYAPLLPPYIFAFLSVANRSFPFNHMLRRRFCVPAACRVGIAGHKLRTSHAKPITLFHFSRKNLC